MQIYIISSEQTEPNEVKLLLNKKADCQQSALKYILVKFIRQI